MVFNLFSPVATRTLNHFLKPFLEDELTFDKTTNEEKKTVWTVKNIIFAPDKINSVLKNANLPFLINDMSVKSILLVDWSKVVFTGLRITLCPFEPEFSMDKAEMFESMIDSFRQYHNEMDAVEGDDQYANAESFAAIEKLLQFLTSSFEVKFEDSAFRIEHFKKSSAGGVALEVRVKKAQIFHGSEHNKKASEMNLNEISKSINIEGVEFFTDEMKRSMIVDHSLPENLRYGEKIEESTPIIFAAVPEVISLGVTFNNDDSSLEIVGSTSYLASFVTPRQIGLLTEVIKSIQPKSKPKLLKNEPLSSDDYDMLERERAADATSSYIMGSSRSTDMGEKFSSNLSYSGWSTKFSSFGARDPSSADVTNLNLNPSTNPTYAHSFASGTPSVAARSGVSVHTEQGPAYTEDIMTKSREFIKELKNVQMKLDFKVNSVCAVVLHEDVIVPDGKASYKDLKSKAELFLSVLKDHGTESINSDITTCRSMITELQLPNNIHFVAYDLSCSMSRVLRESVQETTILHRIQNFQFVEYVMNKDDESSKCFVELFAFKNDGLIGKGNPCLSLSVKTQSTIRNTYDSATDYGDVKTKISLELSNVHTEIDFSIIDRTECFFKPVRFFDNSFQSLEDIENLNIKSKEEVEVSFKYDTDFSLTSASFSIDLRFPVPDLRPRNEVLMKETWKRDIRSDTLTLSLSDLKICTKQIVPQKENSQVFSISSQQVCLLYRESNNSEAIKIMDISFDNNQLVSFKLHLNQKSELPNDKLKRSARKKKYSFRPSPKAYSEQRLGGMSEFSQEPLFYPSTRKVFAEFLWDAFDNFDILLTADFPVVHFTLPNKKVYQELYNRLGYDLLLWQPHSTHSSNDDTVFHVDTTETYHVDTTRTTYEDPLLGSSMTDSIYHSVNCDLKNDSNDIFEKPVIQVRTDSVEHSSKLASGSTTNTKFTMHFKIHKGTVDIQTPSLDEENFAIGTRLLHFDVDDCELYLAASYKGDPNKTYFGIYMKNVELSQDNLVIDKANLKPVITRTPANSRFSFKPPNENDDMISLVLDFGFDDVRNCSTSVVIARFSNLLYDYLNLPSNETWYFQLKDFFTVDSYSISGYTDPDNVNDLHFTIYESLISYKFEDFDTEAIASISSLMFGSRILLTGDFSLFRITLEDFRFFLKKSFSKSHSSMVKMLHSQIILLRWRQLIGESPKTLKTQSQDIHVMGNLNKIWLHVDTISEIIRLMNHFLGMSSANDNQNSSSSDQNQVRFNPDPVLKKEGSSEYMQNQLADAIVEPKTTQSPPTMATNYNSFNFPDDKLVSSHLKDRVPNTPNDEDCTIIGIQKKKPLPPDSIEFMSVPWPGKKKIVSKEEHAFGEVSESRFRVEKLYLEISICPGNGFSDICSSSQFSNVSYSSRGEQIAINSVEESIRISKPKPYLIVEMINICVTYELYPESCEQAYFFNVCMKNMEIRDEMPNSPISKLMCRYNSHEHPIGDKSKILDFQLVNTRTSNVTEYEAYVKCSVGNIRIFLDQATAKFLIDFGQQVAKVFKDAHTIEVETRTEVEPQATNEYVPEQPPYVTFFKKIEINPAIMVVIDFQGNFSEVSDINDFLISLTSTNKLTLKLKEICCRQEFRSLNQAALHIAEIWKNDIRANQSHVIALKLFAPISMFADFIGGVFTLAHAPFSHYMNNGNVARGIVVGTQAFTTQSLSASFGLLGKICVALEALTSFLLDCVSRDGRRPAITAQPPPQDMRAGFTSAQSLVRQRFTDVASDVYNSTASEHRRKGLPGAVSGLVRQFPVVALTGPALLAEGTARLFEGIHNELTPGNTDDVRNKYKNSAKSSRSSDLQK